MPDQKLPEIVGKAFAKNANAVINLTETLSMYERLIGEYNTLKHDFDTMEREKLHLQSTVMDLRDRSDHRQVAQFYIIP